MTRAEARRLQASQARLQQLTAQLAASPSFVSVGSVVRRFMRCGKPNCRCQADPPQLHGPYWQWTRAVNGKTLTRNLTEDQARLYQGWIANRRRLTKILTEMDKVSERAATILLQQPGAHSSDPAPGQEGAVPGPVRQPALRMTRQLAEGLIQISELVSPVADAAQQWLEAKDDGDRELIAQAQEELDTALTESSELMPTMTRLLRLAPGPRLVRQKRAPRPAPASSSAISERELPDAPTIERPAAPLPVQQHLLPVPQNPPTSLPEQ